MMLGMEMVGSAMEQLLDFGGHCVVYHKHRTSARTRFLRVGGDVVLPAPEADEAELLAADAMPGGRVVAHPSSALAALSRATGIGCAALRAEALPLAMIGRGGAVVWLVEATPIEPPQAGTAGGRFVSIIESRDVAPVQRALLRLAYERILG